MLGADPPGLQGQLSGHQHSFQPVQGHRVEHLRHDPISTGVPQQLILQLKPLDRQIILSYLEDMDAAAIAEITGLSPANVAMKIHRIKKLLAERVRKERLHA